jgi:hypothetical protein
MLRLLRTQTPMPKLLHRTQEETTRSAKRRRRLQQALARTSEGALAEDTVLKGGATVHSQATAQTAMVEDRQHLLKGLGT